MIVYLKKLVQSNRRVPDQVITRAKRVEEKAKGSLTLNEIQQAIEQGRS